MAITILKTGGRFGAERGKLWRRNPAKSTGNSIPFGTGNACLACQVQHNDMVRFRATHAVLLTFLLWAGCQSPARRTAQAPVWEDIATTVPASPQFPIAGPIDGGEPAKPTPPTPRILPPSKPTETWVALERWCRANTLCFATQLSGKPAPSYSLQSTNGALVLHTGSQLAQWEGTEVRLGFAPQLIDGRPYVHTLDLNKTILPLLQG